MRILFATTAGAGHLGPLVPFAAAATELGHDVCVAAPGSAEPAVRRVGLPFHAVGESTGAERGAMFGRMRGATFDDRNTIMLRDGFAGIYAAAALPAMSDLIEHWRPDVVVRESLEFSSLAAAAAQGVPHVQVATNLLVTLDDVMARVRPRVTELLATAGVPADRSTASSMSNCCRSCRRPSSGPATATGPRGTAPATSTAASRRTIIVRSSSSPSARRQRGSSTLTSTVRRSTRSPTARGMSS